MNPALYLLRTDAAHEREPAVEAALDRQFLPGLRAVPGVRGAARYRQPSPTEPRHLVAAELDHPGVAGSGAWKAVSDASAWPEELREHTMNRRVALYEWVGGNRALLGTTPYVFWVLMDIEPHREALFNELYDTEHLPPLLALAGCVNAVRYRTSAPGEPRYLCAYEVDRPDLPMSQLWNDTSDIGRWKPEIRPYTYHKKWIVSQRVASPT